MPTLAETREIAASAVLEAVGRLGERGVDPNTCPRLLEAVRRGSEQVILAIETDQRDIGDYRRFLDAVYERLDGDPIVDVLPAPPVRTVNVRMLDSAWRPGPD